MILANSRRMGCAQPQYEPRPTRGLPEAWNQNRTYQRRTIQVIVSLIHHCAEAAENERQDPLADDPASASRRDVHAGSDRCQSAYRVTNTHQLRQSAITTPRRTSALCAAIPNILVVVKGLGLRKAHHHVHAVGQRVRLGRKSCPLLMQ